MLKVVTKMMTQDEVKVIITEHSCGGIVHVATMYVINIFIPL